MALSGPDVSDDAWPPLFSDPYADFLGSVFAFITVIAASTGGIGGGGLLVPLYMIVLDLGRYSIPLSKATIMGAAIANVTMKWSKRHPTADRPLIAFDIALMLEPITLAGTVVGVMLNAVIPQWLITVLLVWLLAFTAQKTINKGFATYQKENKKNIGEMKKIMTVWNPKMAGMSEKEVVKKHEKKLGNWLTKAKAKAKEREGEDEDEVRSSRLQRALDRSSYFTMDEFAEDEPESQPGYAPGYVPLEEAQHSPRFRGTSVVTEAKATYQQKEDLKAIDDSQVPTWMLLVLSGCWVFMFTMSLLKGGHGAPSMFLDVPCGGFLFWLLPSLILLGMAVVTALVGRHLLQLHGIKQRAGYAFVEGDVVWDERGIRVYPAVCVLAGVAAGLLGIGGGMVIGPLMLEMGMLPTVSAATSAFMILFTSSSTVVQFILIGMCRLDYTLWYGAIGACGTVVGQKVANFYMRKYKRQSIIIFALGGIIALSAVVMGLVGGIKVYGEFASADWDAFMFRGLCD